MKYILYSFIVILFSCSTKKQENDINNLKDAIVFIENNNSRTLKLIEKEVVEEGNKPDLIDIYNKAKEVSEKRITLIGQPSFLLNYFNYLKSEYHIIEEKDSTRINRAESLISEFKSNKDSLVFYNTLINLLLIENDILKSISMKVGGSCRWMNLYANVLKDKDTIAINENYSIVVIPDILYPNRVEITPNTQITVLRDNIKENTRTQIEKIGSIIIIKLNPTKAGNYKIQGEFSIKSKTINFSFNNKYIDNFYVKE